MTGDLYFVETSSDIAWAGFELSIQPKILGFHLPGVVMYRRAPSDSDLNSAKDQKQGLCILGKRKRPWVTAEGEGGTVSKGPVMDEPTGKEQSEGSHVEGFISGGEGGGTSWRQSP